MARMPWTITKDMFLNTAEVDALLTHLDKRIRKASGEEHLSAQFDRLIITTLLYSGLRTSEFCTLRVADVVAGPALRIQMRGREQRKVHIPADVAETIADYIRIVRPRWLAKGVRPADKTKPLIYHERGRPFERTGLYRRVVRILTEAGLGGRASVQLLRHTYGYLAYRNTGGNLLFVQRQLGHAHPMITSVYSQFVEESYADLADRVANAPSDVLNTRS